MKKPNITPTPWVISTTERKTIGSKLFILNKYEDALIADCNFHLLCEKENAQAIVTAVNCTYGKNINPEKIQELIVWADEISKKVNTIQRENQLPSWIKDEIGELKHALKNIYFKD